MANAYGIDIYEGEHAPSSSQPRSSLENSGGSIHWLDENPSLSLLVEHARRLAETNDRDAAEEPA